MILASLTYVLLGAVIFAGVILRHRRPFGSGKGETERRKPGKDAKPAFEERRKDDDVGGEA
jgi:hypothetical protein